MKQIYLIELRRMRGSGHLITLMFAGMAASLCAFALVANRTVQPQFFDLTIQSIGVYVMLSAGILIPLVCLTRLGGDMSSGIFSSYLSFPIKTKQILVAKWLAHYTYFVPCIILPSLLLMLLAPYMTLRDMAYIVGLLLTVLFVTFAISVLGALFMSHRPIPEVLTISYALLLTLFENMLPISEPYVYIIDPLRFLRTLYSQSLPLEAIVYGILFVPAYLAILLASLYLFERKKWGDADRT